MRASNAIAIDLLFDGSYSLAQHSGFRPWRTALNIIVGGVSLAAITIALGG